MPSDFARTIKIYFQKQRDVSAVYLFGSRAKGAANPNSDVDIAVLLTHPSGKHNNGKKIKYCLDLEKMLAARVDMVILNDADPFLAHQVYSKGVLLSVKHRAKMESIKWRQVRNYWDMLPVKRLMEDSAIKRLERWI